MATRFAQDRAAPGTRCDIARRQPAGDSISFKICARSFRYMLVLIRIADEYGHRDRNSSDPS